jgi:hypothetical protein
MEGQAKWYDEQMRFGEADACRAIAATIESLAAPSERKEPILSLGGCAPKLFGSGGVLGSLGPFGLTLHVDPDLTDDVMEFRDRVTGRVLAKIINVGKT